MMKRQKVDGNIYRFFGNTIAGWVAAITKSEQDDTLLWHKWLGYIGEHKDGPRLSRPKSDTWICDHDRHANIKPKLDINKNQLNFYKNFPLSFKIFASLLKRYNLSLDIQSIYIVLQRIT